jgi:hypothetical protein
MRCYANYDQQQGIFTCSWEKSIMFAMTPRRAFWEALATVGIPSFVIWGTTLYSIRTNANPDEWPLYLIFVGLPLLLFFPIYKRYKKGVRYVVDSRTRGYHVKCATLYAALSVLYAVIALRVHRNGWDLVIYLTFAAAWLLTSADHIRRAAKSRANLPPNSVAG